MTWSIRFEVNGKNSPNRIHQFCVSLVENKKDLIREKKIYSRTSEEVNLITYNKIRILLRIIILLYVLNEKGEN